MLGTTTEQRAEHEESAMILVTGATGNVGRQVVSHLRDQGAAFRALARDPGAAGLPGGTEVVAGDLSDPGSLHAALDGVDTVFLVWPFLDTEAAPAVLDAVGKHARRIVYLSMLGAQEDTGGQADPITSFHSRMERLIERSGLEWTFLHPVGFASNTLGWAQQVRDESVVRDLNGALARPLIHERDIAAVAAHVLTAPDDVHSGAEYVLTGPALVTQAEQAHAIGEAIGRPVRFEEMPEEEKRRQVLAWLPPSGLDTVMKAWAAMAESPEPVTATVEDLTGTPPRTFREWAADHAADFR
ncbi:NAD(P)H-binding protein [Streptomyces sp. H10-C2]|uniref:NAD(P)H-binding protein n=1 Tax=unclassified Streptomyces TaxID=2593676 RepID=UPI0024BA5384|nr:MULTISPECIES: NAD(P)H-binding protein [unclassified Streptomyces]MDJ0341717.1 NAD(P)H-binding protein [Streptomyces sp. PH10-H1]MDJ0368975.1 NAD(P)H-binding protein [Streptomyces sp. H10-C2]